MKIINLKRVLGSLTLVFAVASFAVQAEVIRLNSVTDALTLGNDRTGVNPTSHSELSLVKIASDNLDCSGADHGMPSNTSPIQIIFDCEHRLSDRKTMPGLLALGHIHSRNSSTFLFVVKSGKNENYQLADVALLAIPPDYY